MPDTPKPITGGGWSGPHPNADIGPSTQPKSPTATWVDLAKLYIRDPGQPPGPARSGLWCGLDLTGEVPGLITEQIPVDGGGVVAIVNYDVQLADGRQTHSFRGQVVPPYALRPRDGDAPLLGLRKQR